MKKLHILWLLPLLIACQSTHKIVQKTTITEWTAPAFLKPGDSVLYVAPAGYVNPDKGYMQRADSLLRLWGYVPVYPKNLYKKNYVFSGTDAERYEELQDALDRPDIKAIWCARGGYGSVRIIDQLNFKSFKKYPKWLIGFSDITVLHSLLHQEGFQSVHAIMPISLTHPNPDRALAIQSIKDFYAGKSLRYEFPSDSLNITGKANAEVVGGNISLLVSLLGSKYQIDPSGKILYLEDVGEYTYSYDRMIYALKNAGYFEHLKGLIIGGVGVKKDDDFIGETVPEIILKHVKNKGYPVVFNFPAGHVVDNRAIIFGKKAKITVRKDRVIFEQ